MSSATAAAGSNKRMTGAIVLLAILFLAGIKQDASFWGWKETLASCDQKVVALHNGANNENAPPVVLCQLRKLTLNPAADEKKVPSLSSSSFKIDSIQCVVKESNNNKIKWIEFEVLECPPRYHQSTFTLESENDDGSRIMGRVGPRDKIRNGCGVYQAKVAVVLSSKKDVTVNLYWTSDYSWYSNRVIDIDVAHDIKKVSRERNMTKEELILFLGEDRLNYLKKHYDYVGGFSFQLVDNTGSMLVLNRRSRDCSDVPLSDWAPVGLMRGVKISSGLHMDSMQCSFPKYTVERLNQDFRGLRIRLLLDSHGGATRYQWVQLLCPNYTEGTLLFQKYHDICPDPQHDWLITWRFFRAIFRNTEFIQDQDGISNNARKGETKACVDFLGLGDYNVTIIGLPTWLFVYETNEGLGNFLIALESLLSECRTLHPGLFERHIFLLQTAMATDSDDKTLGSGGDSWRGIQNYRIQAFSDEAALRLGPLVDGVLPVFDLTFAWLDGEDHRTTNDGIHLKAPGYMELFNMLMAGVSSAMKFRAKENPAIFSSPQVNRRWWVNHTVYR